ncbi:MAG: TonB-dependent siderophore receptor, partial [Comamonadaceae bacterium]|nr:TonB-dependent siderophore receptor [Comamonadaceae bacterium]
MHHAIRHTIDRARPRPLRPATQLLLGLMLLAPCLAQAQPGADAATRQATQAPEPTAEAPELEAVTVSAPLNRAFEVNAGAFGARDTMALPLSIQRYDARHISESAARTALDALALDPSLAGASLGSSFDSFRLRGFKMDNFHGIRRDGIALLPYHDEALENIERIDVLKGPSGFLYGFNSPGGTLNYLLKRPGRQPFVHVTARASSLGGRYDAVDANRSAFDGRLGWRLNAAHEQRGRFNHAGDLRRKFIGLAADLRLGSRALLQWNADWYHKSVVADPLNPASFVLPPRIDRRALLAPAWWRYQTRVANLDARLEYALDGGWVSVTQLAASRLHGGEIFTDYFDIQPNGDIGYADLYAFRQERFANRAWQTHLAGSFTLGRVRHELFVGAAWRGLRGETPQADFIESGPELAVGRISVGNVLRPVQPPVWEFGARRPVAFRMRIREHSLFASDLLHLSQRLQLLLGGRYIRYRASDLQEGAAPQRKNVFVPAAALMYRPSERLMGYLSYARGFEAGEYAPYNANNANAPTQAIASEQLELGLKADWHPRLNLGAALFAIRRDASYLNTANDFVSDGRFLHRGLELNASGRLRPGLTLHGNLAFLDTALQRVSDPATLGKRSEGVPRWRAALGLRHDFASLPGLWADATLSYVGRRPVDAQNSGFIPGYALWDAGIGYQGRIAGQSASLRLHAKNLGNRYYYASAYYQGGL